MPSPVSQLLYYTTVLFKALRYKIKNISSIFCACLFLLAIICVKSYKPIASQHYTAECVSWVPVVTLLDLTNKLDLQMCSQNETHLYTGNLLYGILEPLKKIDFQKGEVTWELLHS